MLCAQSVDASNTICTRERQFVRCAMSLRIMLWWGDGALIGGCFRGVCDAGGEVCDAVAVLCYAGLPGW